MEFTSTGVRWSGGSEPLVGEERKAVLQLYLNKNQLHASTRVYICPQSIMKFHPSFDDAISEVLARDPNALVVLLSDTRKLLWQEQTAARIGLHERIVYVGHLPYLDYMKLVCAADVSLDPFPFGGGVTIFESLGCGVPVVTSPENLKVFNLASAWLQEAGLTNFNLKNDTYAGRAVRLASMMAASRAEILLEVKKAAAEKLFSDDRSVQEWEDFLGRMTKQSA